MFERTPYQLAYEGKRYWDIIRWMLYNDDATASNTTCATLGIEPLNNTYRENKYLQVKDYDGKEDPLTDKRDGFLADLDGSIGIT